MPKTSTIDVGDGGAPEAIRELLRGVLTQDEIEAVLVSRHLPVGRTVMPTLVSDPEALDGADPLAPAFPMNAAKLVSRLTRRPAGGKIAAVMRPCEIRAFVELVKLKQAMPDDLIIIGIDCPGAFANTDYPRFAGDDGEAATSRFISAAVNGEGFPDDLSLMTACRACEHPVPEGADLAIGLLGDDPGRRLTVTAETERGEALLNGLKLKDGSPPDGRAAAVEALVAERKAFRDEMFADTEARTDSLEKLTEYLSGCINCYNCRVACPVCYCKECVFVTDVFNHEPAQYLRWAERKGAIKMPTDTVFYHITRLAHMSTACVGCGQCSNACPNDIPVMELFRTVSRHTQAAFDYLAGRDLDEAPPLSVFREAEFPEVVGIQ